MSRRAAVGALVTAAAGWRPAAPGPEPSGQAVLPVEECLRPLLVDAVRRLLAGAVPAGQLPVGLVLGTHHATWSTAEYVLDTVHGPGPRWLDPRAFLSYSPHTPASALCMEFGLEGPAVTLVGPAAGIDAVGYAALQVELGTCDRVIAAAADLPAGAGGTVSVAAVLVDRLDGAARGAVRVAAWRPGAGCAEPHGAADPPSLVAPLLRLDTWFHTGAPPDTLTVGCAGASVVLTRGAEAGP